MMSDTTIKIENMNIYERSSEKAMNMASLIPEKSCQFHKNLEKCQFHKNLEKAMDTSAGKS